MIESNSQTLEVSPLKRFNACIAASKTQDYLSSVLQEKRAAFVNNITALVTNSESLQQCAPMSVIYAGIKATALDLPLDPSLGCAYVIPYQNRKTGKTDAQFQIGYKGLIQLAIRSGQFRFINVTDIRQGEISSRNPLTGELTIRDIPSRESVPVVGYAAYFKLLNGFEKTLYMTVPELQAHAKKYSQTYSSPNEYVRKQSKWTDDFDKMAKKTVLKLLISRYAPKSVEIQNAVTNDQIVLNDKGQVSYLDNPDDQSQTTALQATRNKAAQVMEAVNKARGENVVTIAADGRTSEDETTEEDLPADVDTQTGEVKEI